MGTKKLYDLAVKVGSYTDSQGQEKGRYQNIGAVMQKDDGGKFLMLAKWFNPAGVPDAKGGESILVSMFPPKDANGQPQQQRAPAPAPRPSSPVGDDDVPF